MTVSPAQRPHGHLGHFPRWLQRLLIATIVSATLIGLLPPAIQFGLERLLREQGLESVSIEDVNLNLFTLNFELYGLSAAKDQQPVLAINKLRLRLSWAALWHKRLQVQSLVLNGLNLRMEQHSDATWQVAGLPLPAQQPAAAAAPAQVTDAPWGLGLQQLRITDSTLEAKLPQFTTRLNLDEMQLNEFYTWLPQQSTQFSLTGRLDDAAMTLQGNASPLDSPMTAVIQLTLDKLALSHYAPLLPQNLQNLSAQLSIDSTLTLSMDTQHQELTQQGKLTLEALTLSPTPWQLNAATIAWEGDTSIALPLDGIASVTADGLATLENLVAADAVSGKTLLTLSAAKLEGVQITSLDDFALTRISLDGLQINLQRNAQGTLLIPRTTEVEAQATAPESTAPAIRVDMISLSGDSRINIEDLALPSAYRQTIHIRKAELSGLDNRTPDKATSFVLSAQVGKFTALEAHGEVKPFTRLTNVELHSVIKSLDLPQITPYSMRYLGYNLTSGHLQAKVDLAIKDDVIRGNSNLHIKQLNIEPADPNKMQRFNEQLKIPLNTALYMLKDKHDNIDLDLPIEGNLQDPSFDISDAINTALAKTMKLATMSYLKLLLQPYGALITLAGMAGDAGTIQFQAVAFAPASAELQPAQIAYLDKLSTMLKERAQLQLRLCGIATASDRPLPLKDKPPLAEPAMLELQNALALERATRIKEYLVEQHGLKAEQLFICLPAIDPEPSAEARVELLL